MPPNLTGKARRDRGCSLAANKKPAKTLALQLLILERAAQGTEFNVDHVLAPDDEKKRENNTGSAFLALSARKLIRFTGRYERSARAYRHAGPNRVWIANDPAKCRSEADAIRAEVTAISQPPKQGLLFSEPVEHDPLNIRPDIDEGVRRINAAPPVDPPAQPDEMKGGDDGP